MVVIIFIIGLSWSFEICFVFNCDGVMPSNEGRGYVLRRIMRRAMRHCHLLGCNEPHLHKIFPTLLEQMGSAFPELIERKDTIKNSLKEEETRFKLTLDRGLKLLGDELASQKDSKLFSGGFQSI